MTNQTRMRMSKEAARLIHEYRDNNEHGNNTEAVFGMAADLDVGVCSEMHLQKEISSLNAALSDANIKIDRIRANLRLAVSQNVDLQSESLRKREQVAILEQSLLDQAIRHDRQLDERKERGKEKLRIKNEWLAIFAVSNVVGWGLAITALAGVMG